MRERYDIRLAELTTLRLGGPAKRLVEIGGTDPGTGTAEGRTNTDAELIELLRTLDDAGEPVLVLGGGSNLLVGDDGFPGTVVRLATRGIDADLPEGCEDEDVCGGVTVRVAAGESWDGFVERAVAEGWRGVEALSGIPGLVGAAPIQNVGAYGQEVAQTLAKVRTYDRRDGAVRTFAAADCGFGYRDSRFKREPGRYVVLEVTFQFPMGGLSAPIAYAELARTLDAPIGARVPATDVRAAVLELRARKGMVLDAADHDTWSAGSFFTNPILSADQAARLPADAPRWPQPDGRVKSSAAWLIEHAGFTKGYGDGPARLSTKHTLALTNRGSARAYDLVNLAREVRAGVRARFHVTLEPEPTLVSCTL